MTRPCRLGLWGGLRRLTPSWTLVQNPAQLHALCPLACVVSASWLWWASPPAEIIDRVGGLLPPSFAY